MAICCCLGCVMPKRYPGCHDHCEEYRTEKAAHDQQKAEIEQARRTRSDIYFARSDKVEKAIRRRRTKN